MRPSTSPGSPGLSDHELTPRSAFAMEHLRGPASLQLRSPLACLCILWDFENQDGNYQKPSRHFICLHHPTLPVGVGLDGLPWPNGSIETEVCADGYGNIRIDFAPKIRWLCHVGVGGYRRKFAITV